MAESRNFSECSYHGPRFFSQGSWRQNNLDGMPRDTCCHTVDFNATDSAETSTRSSSNEEYTLTVMSGPKGKIKVDLNNDELWTVFREKQTEMIITRAGRRMFPVLNFRIAGLEPNDYYSFMVQLTSADNNRYRYDVTSNKWVVTGQAAQQDNEHCTYIHPHGTAQGSVWMKEGAKFDKIKLSNHYKQFNDYIILTSLHKYKAQLFITKFAVPQCERWVFDFPETEFIAVTCYQNPKITKLKIDNNPFAKAFRQGKRPNKQPSSAKQTTSPRRSAKRSRLLLSSPPPVTRLHPPPLRHLPDDTHGRTPTPPLPPLNLYCQSLPPRDVVESQDELALQSSRCIPLVNDPLMWEPQQPMTSQRTCLPPISASFRFDHQPPMYFKPDAQNYCPGWHVPEYQDMCNSYHGNNFNWVGSNGYGGVFDDVQLRHYDNMYWREN